MGEGLGQTLPSRLVGRFVHLVATIEASLEKILLVSHHVNLLLAADHLPEGVR